MYQEDSLRYMIVEEIYLSKQYNKEYYLYLE
jgi:hypothetical protein